MYSEVIQVPTFVTSFKLQSAVMHLSMLSPSGGGGGGPWAYMYMYVGHLTSVAFPTLENLTKNLGPRLGTFALLRGGIRPSHIPCVCLCSGQL